MAAGWRWRCAAISSTPRAARFALPEASLGIMPGGMGTQNLPRAVGERRAKELILSAARSPPPKALTGAPSTGSASRRSCWRRRSPPPQAIAENAPLSVRQAKKSIHYGLQMDLLTGYRFEIEAYNRLVDTDDRREGVRAFNEKRKPDGGNVIDGNYFGVDPTGTLLRAQPRAITITNSPNNRIGGPTAPERNVISGSTQQGVTIQNAGSTGNIVQGNYIGLNAAARRPSPTRRGS